MFNTKDMILGIVLMSIALTIAFFLSGCGTTVITVKNDSLDVVRKWFFEKKQSNNKLI